MNRRRVGFALLICSVLAFLVYTKRGNGEREHFETGTYPILAWTKFFGQAFDESDRFWACPELRHRCPISSDQRCLSSAAAVVFHGQNDLSEGVALPDPALRQSHQYFVFFSHESPESTQRFYMNSFAGDKRLGPNYFNWTMTFRLDSDVPWPYWFLQRQDGAAKPRQSPQDIVWGKKKGVVWAASNCWTSSKRENVVRALAKAGLEVSVVGACGQGPTAAACPRSADGDACLNNLISRSYFHLAFENSVCRDYISEKYWARWELPSVPIVLSREVLSPFAPPNSFIAVDDFHSPKEMVAFLSSLMGNASAYAKYFEWRWQGYQAKQVYKGRYLGVCGLCERLIEEGRLAPTQSSSSSSSSSSSYPSIDEYWFNSSGCSSSRIADRFLANSVAKD